MLRVALTKGAVTSLKSSAGWGLRGGPGGAEAAVPAGAAVEPLQLQGKAELPEGGVSRGSKVTG